MGNFFVQFMARLALKRAVQHMLAHTLGISISLVYRLDVIKCVDSPVKQLRCDIRQMTAIQGKLRTCRLNTIVTHLHTEIQGSFTMPPRVDIEVFRDEIYSCRITHEPLAKTLLLFFS